MSQTEPDQEPLVVVVGASAGGVPALREFVAGLDERLGAIVLVVLHLPATSHSMLPQILSRAGSLYCAHPRDREPLVSGQVFAAPPDHHLLVDGSSVRVTRGPWENGFRPSIDALFRSAAHWYRERVVGIVLTGALDDGAAGLAAVARHEGLAFVQDPSEADVAEMPDSALARVPTAEVAPLAGIAKRVNELAGTMRPTVLMPGRIPEIDDGPLVAELKLPQGKALPPEALGSVAAGLVCPDCNGSLYVVPDASTLRFRCHVGHAWTAEALLDANTRGLEQALWAAVRILEESQTIDDRLAERIESRTHSVSRQMMRRREERKGLIASLRLVLGQLGAASDHINGELSQTHPNGGRDRDAGV